MSLKPFFSLLLHLIFFKFTTFETNSYTVWDKDDVKIHIQKIKMHLRPLWQQKKCYFALPLTLLYFILTLLQVKVAGQIHKRGKELNPIVTTFSVFAQ